MPTSLTDLIARVRAEIGDPPQPFRTTALGDGRTALFDLPKQQIQQVTEAAIVNGASFTTLSDASAAQPWVSTQGYLVGAYVTYNGGYYQSIQAGTNQNPATATSYWSNVTALTYTIDNLLGQIMLGVPIPNNATLIVTGASWSMFSDAELTIYITDATNQHFFGRTVTERFRDYRGFIDYRETPVSVTNMPAIEVPLVVMLATINTFWTLANDTASDFNISTAEGTSIDRTSQYRQIMAQVEAMTQRYSDMCGQLNVGVFRAETLQLRRVSRTTGRLVPVFKPQEYDDHHWPIRELPPVDHRNDDNSGIPSPIWQGYGW